jgi:hypothetical protein
MRSQVRPILLACAVLVVQSNLLGAQTADLEFSPTIRANGHRVYLSPARHSDAAARGECENTNENDLARDAAVRAAKELAGRGYYVRVGRGTYTSAWQNSNAYGADVHVVFHSNSRVHSPGCGQDTPANLGTVVLYRVTSDQSKELAGEIKTRVGPLSPGGHDYICPHPGNPCTGIKRLAEIMQPRAVVAYSESEFHDWSRGAQWLRQNSAWATQIAAAIDEFLHYPR